MSASAVPPPPSPPSEEALYALIQSLQAQIATLEARLDLQPPSPPLILPPTPSPPEPPLSPAELPLFVWWHVVLPVGVALLLLLAGLGFCWYRAYCARKAGKQIPPWWSVFSFASRSRAKASSLEAPGFNGMPNRDSGFRDGLIRDTAAIMDHQNLEVIVQGAGNEESGRAQLLARLFATSNDGINKSSSQDVESDISLTTAKQGMPHTIATAKQGMAHPLHW